MTKERASRKSSAHRNERERPLDRGGADGRIGEGEEPVVHGAKEQEPAEAHAVPAEELPVGAEGFAQAFVMQHERDLHRAEGQEQRRHQATADREVIEHAGDVAKIGDEERGAQQEGAREDDEPEPLQDEAEAPHRETEERFLAEVQPFDPGQADGDEIDLEIGRAEIFENKRDGLDHRRGLKGARGRDEVDPSGQEPVEQGLPQRSDGAEQHAEVDQPAGPAKLPAQRADQAAVQAAPVHEQEDGGEDRKRIGGGRGVEDARDRFRGVEEAFPPDLEETGPVPGGPEFKLLEPVIRGRA